MQKIENAEIISYNDHRRKALHIGYENKTRNFSYKEGYAVIIKGCATSNTQPQYIDRVCQIPNRPRKIFIILPDIITS